MIWVGWRQQRAETVIAGVMLVVLALLLIPTGLQMFSAYDHDGLAACLRPDASQPCQQSIENFTARFASIGNLIDWFTLVPGLIGVLLAAPLTSQFEHGTYRLDWTQSITRRRWLAGKLGLAIGTALVASAIMIALITWWRTPFVRLHGRINNDVFDSEGTVALAYTLFALGLAAAIGVVWRRAVPALVVAFVGYFAARLFVDTWLRQRLISPATATFAPDRPPDLDRAWVLQQFPSDRFGHPVMPLVPACPGSGQCVAPGKPGPGSGVAYMHAVYHPASHFWPLQLIETAIFGGAALALIGFAVWWTLRRMA
jgi:ABC-type transport system involved in multi-copper enzyme maturation permease subunit